MTRWRDLLAPARPIVRWLRRRRLSAITAARDIAQTFHRRRYHVQAPPVCLVSHDAYRHGAQLLLLDLARIFDRSFGLQLHIVLLGPGPLNGAFRRYGNVIEIGDPSGPEANEAARRLRALGVTHAICSTSASGLFVATLARVGIGSVALVHELPGLIHDRGLLPHAAAIARDAGVVVFPNELVRSHFPGGPPAESVILPQGLAKRRGPPDERRRRAARMKLRERHGIPLDSALVLNVGYGDRRKGIDLFASMGARLHKFENTDVRLVWVGALEPEQRQSIDETIAPHRERFVFAGFHSDLAPYLDGADIFALTSREDPFPTAILQARDAGLPLIAFEGAGGFEALFGEGDRLVPADDVSAFAEAVSNTIKTSRTSNVRGENAPVAQSLQHYAFDLATLINSAPPRVSVIVPNYNYGRYLETRLASILGQTLPPYEIILLDDCSTDGSAQTARTILRSSEVEWRIIENAERSASVFVQWRRGVEAARGDFVWIAEADDYCDKRFLEALIPPLAEQNVVLSYCQSRQIDESGRLLDSDYLQYVSRIDTQKWRHAYRNSGAAEIASALAVENTIPNVSACLFRREPLLQTLDRHFTEICKYSSAGDWLSYIRLLNCGDIAFIPDALNSHRRHRNSVTALRARADVLGEIEAIQSLVQNEFNVSEATKAVAARYLEELRAGRHLA